MKTFKQFRNGEGNLRKRPPKRRGKQDNGYLPPQIQSLQGEKGHRIGGSTTYLLPSARSNTLATDTTPFGITRIDTPPPPETEF